MLVGDTGVELREGRRLAGGCGGGRHGHSHVDTYDETVHRLRMPPHGHLARLRHCVVQRQQGLLAAGEDGLDAFLSPGLRIGCFQHAKLLREEFRSVPGANLYLDDAQSGAHCELIVTTESGRGRSDLGAAASGKVMVWAVAVGVSVWRRFGGNFELGGLFCAFQTRNMPRT